MELPSPALAAGELAMIGSGAASAEALKGDARLASLPAHLEPLRILGQGGSSVVYEALHTRLKVKVAIKLLTIDGPHAEQAQKRMLREAELYALLDDPRIPRVYDVNELPDGTPYVVMEMVPGESLEELLSKRGALSPEHALRITRQVLLTLASVHERGVLHRDVKPANVILTLSEEGGPSELRLVDFGIAKMSTRGSGEEAVTQRGALIGTPHYMTPEQLSGYPADASTDVYAVGIMLYEMLAGAVPFSGSSLAAIMAAVMRQVPETLEERGVDVKPELSALVQKAMAREPSDRFVSARDMLEALEALEAPLPQPDEAWRESEEPRPRKRRGRFWFVAALLSTLLICAGFLLAGKRVDLSAESEASGVGRSSKAAQGVSVPSAILPTASAPRAQAAPPSLLVPRAHKDQVTAEPESKPTRHHRSRALPEDVEDREERERTEDREERERTDREERERTDDRPVRDFRAVYDFRNDSLVLPDNPY